ncbi:MAG: sugar phosphate isomerase/epimerase [Planctomycetales bacterium]|nr:sugar phosphate isomerase/epimerase [Planctomycetales bacterium]
MIHAETSRRRFLKSAAAIGIAAPFAATAVRLDAKEEPLFKISLAQWSLHRALRAGKMDNLDFAKVTKREFGIEAVEYVNQFFKDKAKDEKYLGEMKQRAADEGVKSLLIMIDGEGQLGAPEDAARTKAVENHYRWVEAAKFLGCHAIRVNAASKGSYDEQMKLAADGLRRVSEFAADFGLSVIVENHGGLSSNGKWLAATIKSVDLKNCGTLPDFGNFHDYDRYQGVTETMPYAKAVSAKSHDFDDQGNETHTDYKKMMKIVLDAGYHGYVGIEYEGSKAPEPEGIMLTKKLLERVRQELAQG